VPAPTTVRALLDHYDAVFLDAYGVLNDAGGALPGAAALIDELDARGTPWAQCSNDAARLPATVAARLAGFGIQMRVDRVITAGLLIAPYFAANGLAGARCVVLGTPDSQQLVTEAGGVVVGLREPPHDVIVIGDDNFEPFKDTLDATLTAAARALDDGGALHLLVPNPDLIYPKPNGELGITAGAIALVLEAAIVRRHPNAPRFVRLGKPAPELFDLARRRLGLAGNAGIVMIGDQLDTDIAGAVAAGIDSALVAGGVSTWRDDASPAPTWLLPSLMLDA